MRKAEEYEKEASRADEEIAALKKEIWLTSTKVNKYKEELYQQESKHAWPLFDKRKRLKKKIDRLEQKIRKMEKSLWQRGQMRKKTRGMATYGAACLLIVCLGALIAGVIAEGRNSNDKSAQSDAPLSPSSIIISNKKENSPKKTTAVTTAPAPAAKTTVETTAKASAPEEPTAETNRQILTTEAEAAATETETPPAASGRQELVYITDSGTKYHRIGCKFLKSKHEITVEDAIRDGYSPCKVCTP